MTQSPSATLGDRTNAPSVPMPRVPWLTRVFLPCAIVASALAVLAWSALDLLLPLPEVYGVPVIAKASVATDVDAPIATRTVQAAGWIEPDPFPIYATSLIDGVVREVLVLEGDAVAQGQVVARLIDEDERLEVERAEATVRQRHAELDAATIALETRTTLRRGVAVAEARAAAARAALGRFAAEEAAARAALEELEDDLNRKRPLVERGAVSSAEIARLELRRPALAAAVDALPARREELVAALAEADAELDAARERSEQLLEERVGVARADAALSLAETSLREANLRLARTEVRSPATGVVLSRLAAPGSTVSTRGAVEAGRVLSIYDPMRLQVRADVPNADISMVGVGQRAEVTVEALPGTVLRGTVTRVTALADIQKNTVEVKVALDALDAIPSERAAQLRPDMLCRVRIAAADAGAGSGSSSFGHEAIFAPRELIANGTALVAGAPRAGIASLEARAVTLGPALTNEWVEVRDGLRPGDVLVDPTAARAGDRVRIRVGAPREDTLGNSAGGAR